MLLKNGSIRILLAIVIACALPFILRTDYNRSLLVLTVIFAIFTLSLDIIISGMGQFSFGHQALFAIGGYATGILTVHTGVSPFLGLLLAPIVSGIAGLFIGYVALRSTRGVYLAIITLGFTVILETLASYRNFRTFTGGTAGISQIPPPVIQLPGISHIVIKSETSYYYLALICLLLVIFIISRWQRSRFGRAVAALRENENLAKSIGISPVKLYTMAFVLASAIAGLAGALSAHYSHYVYPGLFDMNYILMPLVMLFVGGPGTFIGPILGSAIFTFGSMPASSEISLLIFGIILLLFIRFMPHGVYSYLKLGIRSLFERYVQGKNKERAEVI